MYVRFVGHLTCVYWVPETVDVRGNVREGFTLQQGTRAQRGSRVIAILFHDLGTRCGVGGQRHTPAAFTPRERLGTHFTGGWVGSRAGLGRCGKSRPHRDSIPGPSIP